jgi:hypothetical protein
MDIEFSAVPITLLVNGARHVIQLELFEELRWVHGMIRRDLENTAFFPALRDAPEPRRA